MGPPLPHPLRSRLLRGLHTGQERYRPKPGFEARLRRHFTSHHSSLHFEPDQRLAFHRLKDSVPTALVESFSLDLELRAAVTTPLALHSRVRRKPLVNGVAAGSPPPPPPPCGFGTRADVRPDWCETREVLVFRLRNVFRWAACALPTSLFSQRVVWERGISRS